MRNEGSHKNGKDEEVAFQDNQIISMLSILFMLSTASIRALVAVIFLLFF